MLKGKKLTNYMVYAIGEIILVVIGILIALWINNWNQGQQIEKSNENLQNNVLAQLNSDLNDIENFRSALDTLNNVYLKFLDRDYDVEMARNKNMFSIILFDINELGLDKHNLNLIANAQLDNSKSSEILIDMNAIYKIYFKNIDDVENVIYNKLSSNLEILEATQPWYTELITDFSCKTDCVKFLGSDKKFKARIASLRLLYISAYGDLVKGFYYDLKETKEELEESIKNAK